MNQQHMAGQLAQYGRHGDQHLLHVSGDELRGIAALAPNGRLTINPVTGLPEAFSLKNLFKTLLPIGAAIFAPMALPALAPAMASGIGSGLATAAMTGDLKRGLVSGIIGAGLGSAMGAASKAAAATNASEGMISDAGIGIAGIGSEVAASPSTANALLSQSAGNAINASSGGIGSLSAGQYAAAPFTESKAFMSQLMKPTTMIPMALGAGQLSQWDMQEQMNKLRKEQEEKRKQELAKSYANVQSGYRLAQPYAQTGYSPERSLMSRNSPLPIGYSSGGSTTKTEPIDLSQYPWLAGLYGAGATGPGNPGYQGIDPVTVQKNLRGRYSVAPQRQYMPGLNPEFMYFQDDQNNIQQPPITYANTWNRMYAQMPIESTMPTTPYFDNILEAAMSSDKGVKKMAEGGTVPLQSSMGPTQVAEGGIANIPTEFSQPQQQPTQPDEKDLQIVAAALTGQIQNPDKIIEAFISKYGVDMFRSIREMILQSVAPNAQTEGMVQGQGGGMDDQVQGTIGGQQPVAVSPGEYIVPADVVSGLGDGSSDSGAQELDRMAQNVRMARGGSIQQPPAFNARRMMPA